MDRKAWCAAIHRITKSWTEWLNWTEPFISKYLCESQVFNFSLKFSRKIIITSLSSLVMQFFIVGQEILETIVSVLQKISPASTKYFRLFCIHCLGYTDTERKTRCNFKKIQMDCFLPYTALFFFILYFMSKFSQFNCSVMSYSLWPYGLQYARLLCLSPSPAACLNSSPLSLWYHSSISSSEIPFFSFFQSFPAPGSFLMNQFFASGGQSALASVWVLKMNIQNWYAAALMRLRQTPEDWSYLY